MSNNIILIIKLLRGQECKKKENNSRVIKDLDIESKEMGLSLLFKLDFSFLSRAPS